MEQRDYHPSNLVFICYSRRDRSWVDRIRISLTPLARAGTITLWSDGQIEPGADWMVEIREALAHANVGILVVSPDFLASEFISTREFPALLDAARSRGTTLLPVIVRPSAILENHPLHGIQGLNDIAKPLSSLRKSAAEQLLVKLTFEIETIVERKAERKGATPPEAKRAEQPVPSALRPNPVEAAGATAEKPVAVEVGSIRTPIRSVFVLRPFGIKNDSAGEEIDFDRVHAQLIAPAAHKAGIGGGTTGEIVEAGNVRGDMLAGILNADLVICDITIHHAGVFYALGLRHALRRRHTLLLKGETTGDRVPFDLLTHRFLSYDVENPSSVVDSLVEMIESTSRSDLETDSPIFQMIPALSEPSSSAFDVVPLEFTEEVEAALASGSADSLRNLAEDAQKYQWAGLELIADAQWRLRDYEGVRMTLEMIRSNRRDDAAANLRLAYTYERLYRSGQNPEQLDASDQAISRVLGSNDASPKELVEAMALKGRNQKARWRQGLDRLETVSERRRAAMNQHLTSSYEAYREAFNKDFNHFYPGLAALQMGEIFLSLSSEMDGDSWNDAFESDAEADAYRTELAHQVKMLRVIVGAVLEDQRRRDVGEPGDVWTKIAYADLAFLTDDREDHVVWRYREAIAPGDRFVWDAAKGQLELFASLGVRENVARRVIAELDAQYPASPSTP